MNLRTVGSIGLNGKQWVIAADPDVMIRLKRLIPGVKTGQAAALLVSDTTANARELEWVLSRWSFYMTDDDRDHLTARADADRDRERLVAYVLAGANLQPGPGWLESALPLRDYQRTATDLIRATNGALIVDELGLGKTLTSLALLEDPKARPALAVTLTGLGRQWLRELGKFYPDLTGVELHTTKADKEFPRICNNDGFIAYDLVVTNYSKLSHWSAHLAGHIRTVIFDEVQELRRSDSLKYQGAEHIARQAATVTGLSATPVYNYGGEMFSLMDVISPGCLGDRDEFLREWSSGSDANGKVRVKNPEALRTLLTSQGLFLRRTREDVGIHLPAIETIEQLVPSDPKVLNELSGNAIEIARLILSTDATSAQRWQSAGELDWRLRQATGVSKAPFVADFVKLLLSSEDKVLLFGWHRACFGAGTRTVMHDGSLRGVEEVREGDRVMGPDSTPRTVKRLVRGTGNLFRIVPNKGNSWVCSEHHVLTVWNGWAKRYEKWTAAEFASKPERWQRDRMLYRSAPVEYPCSHPVTEPWLLGYWLGDGAASLRDLRVTSADPEVEAEVRRIAARWGLSISRWASQSSAAVQLGFSSGLRGPKNRNRLLNHFRDLGLNGNKRIPHSYLVASVEARQELLAGLIDSDGHMYRSGTAEFVNTNRALAEDAARVARSLGLAAYVIPYQPKSGFGQRRELIFRVSISGDLTPIPTRIQRKRGTPRAGHKDVLRTGFRIEPAGTGDYFGFELDGDHLFLLDDFTVVHNCYDIWLERLKEFNPLLYTGTESAAAKAAAFEQFVAGDCRVLIMSLRSGAGLDGLQNVSSTLVFGELDWSPGVHRQAIGRLGRPGQTRGVLAYFCVTNDGSDPVILDTLSIKQMESDRLIEPELQGTAAAVEERTSAQHIKRLAASLIERAGGAP